LELKINGNVAGTADGDAAFRRSTEQEHAIMFVGLFLLCLLALIAALFSTQWFLGLFLLCLATFIAALFLIHWLAGFLASVAMTGSVEAIIALGGLGAAVVLARHDLGGMVIAVAIVVFWSLVLLGTESATLMPTLTLAAAALYTAAAATLMESILRRRA
jgi:hypothetical protein